MGVAELAHRLREALRRQSTRWLRQGWAAYAHEPQLPAVLPGLKDRVHMSDEALRTAIAQGAKRFRQGQFTALGVHWPAGSISMAFDASLWTLDPCTGKSWPGSERYCFDIAYRLERGIGDVKYVWEFGRLQFLPLLAADAALNGCTPSLEAVGSAIDSWYENNPPFRGIHWAELLNVAIRAINLLVALSLCGDRLRPATLGRARAMLAAHARLLALFPSLHSSANNHLVAECAAEYLIAVAVPELPDAGHARAAARAQLVTQCLKQILPDGWPAEQSPSYGAFTAEFILLASVVAEAASEPFATEVAQRLDAFAMHVVALANRHGVVPPLCDNDEGRVLTSGEHEADYPMSIAAAICAVHGRALAGEGLPGLRLRDAIFGRPGLGPTPVMGTSLFADGGCSVDRRQVAGRACLLTFDHGPLGYLSIAAHGHADALSVTLDVDGDPMLVDPGTYLYHSGGQWRDWFRSTRAHNTLNLQGADQSTMAGPFNWSAKADARLESTGGQAAWPWRASHDGYMRRFGLRHERTIVALDDGYQITDRLLGKAPAPVTEVVFQLGLAYSAVRDGSGFIVHNRTGPVARLVFEAQGDLLCQRGGAMGAGGWVSPRFGVRQESDRISWCGHVPADGAVVRIQLLTRDRITGEEFV
ncbi:hypothetical protein AQPW35_41900 [Rubrivivax pictus]|uniref:Uncharacterized protein n=2 Tax=Pseudaquabacterium pictum TaxID=2315236 RepID=A0A480ATT4_9BURK|nr:hypothetical protein AQPW35_41900 [Rubrivivax pictus]